MARKPAESTATDKPAARRAPPAAPKEKAAPKRAARAEAAPKRARASAPAPAEPLPRQARSDPPTRSKAAPRKPRTAAPKVKDATPLTGVQGRLRVVIEGITPQVDGGRFPAKRVVGETVRVEADVFTDGHDKVSADLLYRFESEQEWRRVPMEALVNDRFAAEFPVGQLGRYRYTIMAWVDHFATWRHDLEKRRKAGQDLAIPYAVGLGWIRSARERASREDAAQLKDWAQRLEAAGSSDQAYEIALAPELAELMRRYPEPDIVARFEHELEIQVDRERARFSSWYELFPRSTAAEPGRHGSFKDLEARLPYIAGMGFDVLYLPPIHPIGRAYRKGPNNNVESSPEDVGSPWAIGSEEGGHKAIHPELGTIEDFRRLRERAAELGLELALDIAFQASPDHPYVKDHPEWFLKRPDGSIQYAENPPKKYQDIYPFHFESDQWASLWRELKSVFEYWIGEGVKIFRVDNPHTKPFPFWEWCIGELKREHPELIFLSEAFTRPKIMHRLAKLGFSQSYTYFTWRNHKQEIAEYLEEVCRGPGREYFRPNFWPNTPDILHEYLQMGGRPAFITRLVLAATATANYGIYGPAFELVENRPRESGSEEYLDSEKYQLRHWELEREDSLSHLIARVNRIRREQPALQSNGSLRLHPVDNEQLLAFSKGGMDGQDLILTVVNLDPFHVHSGWLTLPLGELGLSETDPYEVEDLLSGARYMWHGPTNFVQLNPQGTVAHILRVRQRLLREQDFDGFE